jgi:heat shock protein HslJ
MILSREEGSSRLKGHAGCNGLGGDYKVEGHKITFQPITTRMYCESQMEVENLFTGMLSAADSYRIVGETLELYSQNALLGKFNRKAP